MAILVNYDISGNKHTQFKNELKALKYFESFNDQGQIYALPATTLGHTTKTKAEGLHDLGVIAAKLQVTLERAIVTDFPPYAAIKGIPW
jgi:hypothetical protein